MRSTGCLGNIRPYQGRFLQSGFLGAPYGTEHIKQDSKNSGQRLRSKPPKGIATSRSHAGMQNKLYAVLITKLLCSSSSPKMPEGMRKKVQHLHGLYETYAFWNSSKIHVFSRSACAPSRAQHPTQQLSKLIAAKAGRSYKNSWMSSSTSDLYPRRTLAQNNTQRQLVFQARTFSIQQGLRTMGEEFWIKIFTARHVAPRTRSQSTEPGPEIKGVLPPGRTWPTQVLVLLLWFIFTNCGTNKDVTRQLQREFTSSPLWMRSSQGRRTMMWAFHHDRHGRNTVPILSLALPRHSCKSDCHR